MDTRTVVDNLARVRERMAAACARSGRQEQAVRLVAVTKRIDLELVAAAVAAGQRDLGENRLPAGVARQAALAADLAARGVAAPDLRWHFIGHLQGNKAARAGGSFALIHGVDSEKLADRLARLAVAAGRTERIMLEVNISGEVQKHGFAPEAVVAAAARIAELPGLELTGLMGMARFGAPESELRADFAGLRRLVEAARVATGAALPELSMGMSGDFEVAIAEGSTIVRIGGAIFGPRS